jgi:hypothetical protein
VVVDRNPDATRQHPHVPLVTIRKVQKVHRQADNPENMTTNTNPRLPARANRLMA